MKIRKLGIAILTSILVAAVVRPVAAAAGYSVSGHCARAA
jgi:hypothetical protein